MGKYNLALQNLTIFGFFGQSVGSNLLKNCFPLAINSLSTNTALPVTLLYCYTFFDAKGAPLFLFF